MITRNTERKIKRNINFKFRQFESKQYKLRFSKKNSSATRIELCTKWCAKQPSNLSWIKWIEYTAY